MKSFRNPTDEWLKGAMGEEANPMVTMLSKLTDEQYNFCREYVTCGSPKVAAQKAGINDRQNPHLLVHLPKIAACINILTAKREHELGKKSAAEILERLRHTPLVEADDFNFGDDAIKEREGMLAGDGKSLKGLDDNALMENILTQGDPAAALMQLPRVKVSQANLFGPSWVIERIVTVAERCLQIEPVFDRKGRPLGEFQFNAAGALKSLELLGKTMAMFRDKVEVVHELSQFKESELDERIRALVEKHPDLARIIEMEVDVKKVEAA